MDFYRRCPACGQIEKIYKKRVYVNSKSFFYPNKFYICQNPNCFLFINLNLNKREKFCFVDESFYEWVLIFDPEKNLLNKFKKIIYHKNKDDDK